MQNDENQRGTSGRDLCGPDRNDNRRGLPLRPLRNPDRHGADANPSDPANPGNGANPARVLRMRENGLPEGVRRKVRGLYGRVQFTAYAWDPVRRSEVYIGSFDDPEAAGHVAAEAKERHRAEALASGWQPQRARSGRALLSRGQKDLGRRIRRRNADGTLSKQAAEQINGKIRAIYNENDARKTPARVESVAPYLDAIEAIMEDADIEQIDATIERISAEIPVDVRRACFALPVALDPLWPFRFLIEAAHGKSATMERIAAVYGVSRQRIEQIEVRICAIAKKPLREWADHRTDRGFHVLADCGTGEE